MFYFAFLTYVTFCFVFNISFLRLPPQFVFLIRVASACHPNSFSYLVTQIIEFAALLCFLVRFPRLCFSCSLTCQFSWFVLRPRFPEWFLVRSSFLRTEPFASPVPVGGLRSSKWMATRAKDWRPSKYIWSLKQLCFLVS